MARCLPELNVSLDDGLEDETLKVLLDLFVDLIIQAGTAIIHGHEEALNLQLRIETATDDADRIEELRDPFEGKILALYGDEYRV